jgi:hypothetical protein
MAVVAFFIWPSPPWTVFWPLRCVQLIILTLTSHRDSLSAEISPAISLNALTRSACDEAL